MSKATQKQIREFYKSNGYDVHITKDGHVTYRPTDRAWKSGKNVSDYETDPHGITLRGIIPPLR